ncbi:MAG: radical SAM protein, partial [Candidatus Lokiarchaeota archaeon]|nr:radical SAM protein [Candidatus Lokiarchaeota archaeon]
MNNRLISKSGTELRSYFQGTKPFQRYDVGNICKSFDRFLKNFKATMNRDKFLFEILDDLLNSLDSALSSKIQKTIHSKDFKWFERVGQYFFYNLTQWKGEREKNRDQFIQLFDLNDKQFYKKWWKFFIDYEEIYDIESKSDDTYPKKILLELTNNCNLRCIMCGVGEYGYDEGRNMNIHLFENLCKNVLNKSQIIRINGLGESTILPDFQEYLFLLSELDKQLEIVTNLTVQNKKIWQTLIELNTNFLISCDGANQSMFEAIRRGAKFEHFLKNLEYIGQNINDPLQAQIIFTLMKQNMTNLPKIIELCSEYRLGGIIVNVIKSNEIAYFSDDEIESIKQVFVKSFDIAKDLNILLKLPDHIGKIPINRSIATKTCQKFCQNPWEEVYIRYNGDLTPCNMLNPYIYGNLN